MRLRSILTFSLLTVIVFVGCAPATTPEPNQPEMPAPVENAPTATIAQPEATSTDVPSMEAPSTESPAEVPQVVATSRGPNLEATDPSTYTRASGGLQLVEFFAFW